jgi:hypothetical protein
MLAADSCASSLSNPAVLFLRRPGDRRAEGVAVAMFGLSLVWTCSSADVGTISISHPVRTQCAIIYRWATAGNSTEP